MAKQFVDRNGRRVVVGPDQAYRLQPDGRGGWSVIDEADGRNWGSFIPLPRTDGKPGWRVEHEQLIPESCHGENCGAIGLLWIGAFADNEDPRSPN